VKFCGNQKAVPGSLRRDAQNIGCGKRIPIFRFNLFTGGTADLKSAKGFPYFYQPFSNNQPHLSVQSQNRRYFFHIPNKDFTETLEK
jgi:hypothetical protein